MLNLYNDVLTVEDLCEILHMGKNSVYQILRDKIIPNRKIRHRYIIPKQGVINYLISITDEN